MNLSSFQSKRIRLVLLLVLSTLLMYGCGPKSKLRVYRDAPTISDQKQKVEIKEVSKYIFEWGSKESSLVLDTLNSMGYPIGFANEPYGVMNTVMRHDYYTGRYDWKLSDSGSSAGRNAVLQKTNVDYIENHSLGKDDVTIFEIKIVGLSNHIETAGSKRFSGPVPPFNWVDLFKGRVPVDREGYLMTATVAMNYLDRLDIDDDVKYFVHMPIIFDDNNDIGFKGRRTYRSFGSSKDTPFIKVQYNEKQSFSMRNCSVDVVNRYANRKSSNMSDGSRKFFKMCGLQLGNEYYRNFFYMNPSFLTRHDMLETPKTRAMIERDDLEKIARYSVYPNEQKLEKINQDLNFARYYAFRNIGKCKARVRHNNQLARAVRTAKQRRRTLASANKGYAKRAKWLRNSQQTFANAVVTVGKWADRKDGMGVTTYTLNVYKKMAEDMMHHLPKAEKQCEAERSSISAISGASIRSNPSFLSIVGGAIQNEYKRSYSSGSSNSYSGSSGSSRGSRDSVDATWRQVNADLSQMYSKAIAEENARKSQRQSAYQAKLQQLRHQQSRKVKKAPAPAASRYRAKNKSKRRQVAGSNQRSNSSVSGNSGTASSRSANNQMKPTARNNVVVENSKTTKKSVKSKIPCTGKFESVGSAPKGKCGYVYSDYTRNARLDYGDYTLVLNSSSEKGAKSDLKHALRDEAEKVCKASGYEFMVHESSFKHRDLDWQVTTCKDNGKKGVFKMYKCKGTASFVCGRSAGS